MHSYHFLSHTDNWKCLHFPDSVSENDEFVKDIWDGGALKTMITNGQLNPTSVPLMISINGIAIFKSSTVSLWPVALVVLNLPPAIRMNSKNIILGGFWIGPSKPDTKSLLGPVVEGIHDLSTKGLEIVYPRVVLGIFDLPAFYVQNNIMEDLDALCVLILDIIV